MRSFSAAGGLLIALIAMTGCSQGGTTANANPNAGNPDGGIKPAVVTTEPAVAFKVTYEATSDGKVQAINYNVPDSADTQRDFRPAAPWKKEVSFPKKGNLTLTVAGSSTVDANYQTKYPKSTCRILVDGQELVKKSSDSVGVAKCEAAMK